MPSHDTASPLGPGVGVIFCLPVPSKHPSHPDHLYIGCFEQDPRQRHLLIWGSKAENPESCPMSLPPTLSEGSKVPAKPWGGRLERFLDRFSSLESWYLNPLGLWGHSPGPGLGTICGRCGDRGRGHFKSQKVVHQSPDNYDKTL